MNPLEQHESTDATQILMRALVVSLEAWRWLLHSMLEAVERGEDAAAFIAIAGQALDDAEAWSEDDPKIRALVELFKRAAVGSVPQGRTP